jgi:hypothetical protein
MKFTLFGQITGHLCAEHNLPLTHGTVRLYQQEADGAVLTQVVSPPKDTLHTLTAQAVAAMESKLLGTGTIDAHGDYRVQLDAAKSTYVGGPVLIVLELRYLPPMSGPEKQHSPVYYAITSLQPRWELSRGREQATDRFDFSFPDRVVAAILAHFDIWVISGRVVHCADAKVSAAGVTVHAKDADFLADDTIGSAVTDAHGNFRIYYRSGDFKRTFLSPLLNVETLGAAGPDLYFLITGPDGSPLLAEARADGKKTGRKDAGYIFCTTLCADFNVAADTDAAFWKGIGTLLRITTPSDQQHFDEAGFAMLSPAGDPHRMAVTGQVTLTGQKPDPLKAGNPIEYRFLVARTTASNQAPALDPSHFTEIIGVNSGLLAGGGVLGTLFRTVPSLRQVEVAFNTADMNSDGWVDVRKAVQRTLLEHPTLDPSDLLDPNQSWHWSDADWMLSLNTATLTDEESRQSFKQLQAGAPLPAGFVFPPEKVAIRFEIRDQVTLAPQPGNGTTLNAMVINNDPVIACLEVKNAAGTQMSCDKFKNEDVYIAYTIAHPYLAGAGIQVRSETVPYTHSVESTPMPIQNQVPFVNDRANNPKYKLDPRPEVTCSYKATLGYTLLLHNGDAYLFSGSQDKTFYYEA